MDGRKGSIVTNVNHCCWEKYRPETTISQEKYGAVDHALNCNIL